MSHSDEAGSVVGDPVIGSGWISPASYWMPNHIVQSAWLEHAPFAFWMVESLRPASFVELGTHNGFSFFTVCDAVKRLDLTASCVALDSWEGDDQAGFYGEEVYQAVRTVRDAEYPEVATLLRGYFSESADRIPDGSVDLLHIDGRHGYEDAVEDWETYAPKLSSRGVVMFHDTFEFENGFGVHRLWAELVERFPETSFQFEHGHGLGVIGVGPDLPESIRGFFAAAQTQAERIRSDYHHLGRAVAVRYEQDLEYRNRLHLAAESTREITDRLQEAERRAVSAEQERAAVLSSTSWRATAPLRKVVGALRRS